MDVVKRNDSNYGEVVTCITDMLLSLMTSDAKSRTAVRNAARATAARADWSEFMPFYVEAYDLAESKAAARLAH